MQQKNVSIRKDNIRIYFDKILACVKTCEEIIIMDYTLQLTKNLLQYI
jgi:hypothetical protein